MRYKRKEGFPENFLWGASTSAFQVEGGYNEGGKGLSTADIASFKHSDVYADTKVASDFYHKYKEDIAMMGELGLKSYRFSINWTRIFPNGDDEKANQEGIDFYNKVFDELEKYNIEPIVTLYHFDMPYHLIEKYGGWASRECIKDYIRYCKICFESFGDRVKYWLTINEQNLMLRKDKLMFIQADDEQTKEKIRHQMNHHMFLAGAQVIKLCRKICPDAKIGPTFAYLPSYPATCDPKDVIASMDANNLYNYYLTDIHVFGKYPEYYLRYLDEKGWMPEFEDGDEEILKDAKPDFIGFNYYLTYAAQFYKEDEKEHDYNSILHLKVPGKFHYVDNPYLEATEYGWQIDPIGFRRSLMELYQRYHLPLMITENGMGTADKISDDGKVHDTYRIQYLKEHIKEMKKAVMDGVEVISYNTWTFIDVVSSSNGFTKRYGLVYVDRDELNPKDLNRVRKDSFYYYKDVIEKNGNIEE